MVEALPGVSEKGVSVNPAVLDLKYPSTLKNKIAWL
jgi:hypothetical protein